MNPFLKSLFFSLLCYNKFGPFGPKKYMPQCRECKYYRPKNDKMGECVGYEVSADGNTDDCPWHAFAPKLATEEKS